MKTRSIGRRALLLAAGAAAAAAIPGAEMVEAQTLDLVGSIVFEDGDIVPKGQLFIYVEDPAIEDKASRRLIEMQSESSGKAKSLSFSITLPAGQAATSTRRIVVRLQRADGFLLARGTAPLGTAAPLEIKLRTVIY